MLAWKECINMDESTHEPVPKSTKKRKGDGHDGDDDDAPKRKAVRNSLSFLAYLYASERIDLTGGFVAQADGD
jgi:hypothetical protein